MTYSYSGQARGSPHLGLVPWLSVPEVHTMYCSAPQTVEGYWIESWLSLDSVPSGHAPPPRSCIQATPSLYSHDQRQSVRLLPSSYRELYGGQEDLRVGGWALSGLSEPSQMRVCSRHMPLTIWCLLVLVKKVSWLSLPRNLQEVRSLEL